MGSTRSVAGVVGTLPPGVPKPTYEADRSANTDAPGACGAPLTTSAWTSADAGAASAVIATGNPTGVDHDAAGPTGDGVGGATTAVASVAAAGGVVGADAAAAITGSTAFGESGTVNGDGGSVAAKVRAAAPQPATSEGGVTKGAAAAAAAGAAASRGATGTVTGVLCADVCGGAAVAVVSASGTGSTGGAGTTGEAGTAAAGELGGTVFAAAAAADVAVGLTAVATWRATAGGAAAAASTEGSGAALPIGAANASGPDASWRGPGTGGAAADDAAAVGPADAPAATGVALACNLASAKRPPVAAAICGGEGEAPRLACSTKSALTGRGPPGHGMAISAMGCGAMIPPSRRLMEPWSSTWMRRMSEVL